MSSPSSDAAPLAPHVEETVRAVEQLHTDHDTSATPLERLLDHLKATTSAPLFVVWTAAIIVAWMVVNAALGRSALDPPPFSALDIVLSSLAFLFTILILATQRRADALAAHREQLILQLAFVSEQKTAKIVALLEELRRDSPQVRDRVDQVAEEMIESLDPRAASEALRQAVEER